MASQTNRVNIAYLCEQTPVSGECLMGARFFSVCGVVEFSGGLLQQRPLVLLLRKSIAPACPRCPKHSSCKNSADRCNALSAWLANKSPQLWLKPSSEVKVWVKDIFRRPQTGPAISETEVSDPVHEGWLLCCLRLFVSRNTIRRRALGWRS